MRTLSITLCFLTMVGQAQATPKYPQIFTVQGKVQWTDKDGKETAPKIKQVLIEKASLQTAEKSEVVVELDPHRKLKLFANSRVEIPAISWETGEAAAVILRNGTMRWEESRRNSNVALRSDLFEFLSPVGDFIFKYDPQTAVAEVLALNGSMEFSALNGEDVALVTAGQKVQFQGVREGGEIVYDILLKGKKIPRGKLGLVEPLSEAEKKSYSPDKEKKRAEEIRKKALAEQKAQQKPKDPHSICEGPAARLNQCAWVCENNPKKEKKTCRVDLPDVRCVRQRCNANGVWSESTPSTGCGLAPVVKNCDY